MKRISLPLIALIAAFCAFAPNASAIGAAPTVTITAPASNTFASVPPALTFTTTGTGLTKTCTLSGPGADEFEEPCSSGYKPLSTLPEGTYTYGVSVSNADGTAATSRSFKIDKTTPVITVTDGPAEGAWTNALSASVTVSVTDANPAFLNCRIDDGIWGDCVNGTATGGTNTYSNMTEGSHRFWFFATDKASNTWAIFRTVNVDRTAPSASVHITGQVDSNDNTPAFALSSGDNFGVASRECRIVGTSDWVACNGSTWLYSDGVTDGTHTVQFRVTDNAGNQSTAEQSFTVDSTLPTITYGGFDNDKTTDTLPAIEFYVDDAHDVTARCAFDAADWDSLAVCGEGLHGSAAPLALGTHQFWVSATDSYGNVASLVYTFEIVAPSTSGGPTGGGQTGTPNGAPSGAATAVTLKTSSTKVKKGKFTLTVVVTATNTACRNAEIVVAPKVKKAKAFMVRSVAKSQGGACVATAKIKLAAKFKKKKATITAAQGGVSKQLTIKL